MAESIGTLSQASGNITVVNSEGQERMLSVGDPIFEGDVITVSGGGSSAGITFNNGCMMTLFEGETALIDETAYKLEFYDDAEVVVDLESVDGISEEVAALDSEDADETIGGLEDLEEETINPSELEETASGEVISNTPGSESDIQERLESDGDTPETTVIGNETPVSGAGEDVTVTEVERGGEVVSEEDTTAPVTPTIDVTVGGDNGYSNDNTPELSGTGEAGTTIVIYDTYIGEDGTQTTIIGETTVGDDGTWSYTTDPLLDGTHTITIESVDDAGNSTMNENVASIIIDTVAPDTPNIDPINFTNDATPTISGDGTPGDQVSVSIGEDTYTTTVDDSGHWEIVSEELSDGNYEVVVNITDAAGNVSPVQTSSFTVDTTAPDAPQVTDISMTDPSNVTISGNAEADSELEVTLGDVTENLTTNSDGTWSIDFTGLNDGEHTVTITASDSSGNTSTTVLASIIVDSDAITYEVQLDESGGEGTLGMDNVTIHAFNADDEFDIESETLDLSNTSTEDVSIHDQKGIGAGGETQGEDKATSEGEGLIIELEEETESIDIDINKLGDNENGRWIVYDEDMQRVGEGTFSGDDINIEGQEGTLTIDQDDVDGAFSYVVLVPEDADNGQPSSFFVTDVSYGGEDDTYTYNLELNEVPDSSSSDTDLYIEGLSGDVVLEDGDGNAIGSYNDDGMWVISSEELEGLVEDGGLDLQIISDTELDLENTDFQFTTVDIAYNSPMNYDSPLVTQGGVFDFDSLSGMQTLNMSEDEVGDTNLSLQDVLALSNGGTQLGIISGEVDNHSLTLDSDSWTLKTDVDGNPVTIENDGGNFVVYSSTDADNAFDLVIDEMITVMLES